MEKFKCNNPECKHKPVLFEAEFVGTIKKKCPSCSKIIEFSREKFLRVEKFCNMNNN